jgi:hypothetical protein
VAYSARGKSPDEILEDFEAGHIASRFSGNTTEYMQAALAAAAVRVQEQAADTQARAAKTQERWGKVATLSGCVGAAAAIAAVVVAALH